MDGLHARVYSRVCLAEGYALMSCSVVRRRRRGDTTSGVRHGSAAYVVLPWSSVVARLWVVVVGVDSWRLRCDVRACCALLQRIFAPVFVVVMFLIFYLGIISGNDGSNSSTVV